MSSKPRKPAFLISLQQNLMSLVLFKERVGVLIRGPDENVLCRFRHRFLFSSLCVSQQLALDDYILWRRERQVFPNKRTEAESSRWETKNKRRLAHLVLFPCIFSRKDYRRRKDLLLEQLYDASEVFFSSAVSLLKTLPSLSLFFIDVGGLAELLIWLVRLWRDAQVAGWDAARPRFPGTSGGKQWNAR